MPVPKIESVPTGSIAEVRAFARAARDYQRLRAKHAKVFAELDEIAARYNATLDAADAVVRPRKVSCAPFVLKYFNPKRDIAKLCELLGRNAFVSHGGVIATEETITMDAKRFDALLVAGGAAESFAEQVVTYGPAYDKPGKIELP